ncbi:MAG: DinB family protein [Maioricimonas sp. JB049]
MKFTEYIAKHLRDVHFGGNWTAVNLKDKLADVTWQQATTPIGSLHTIAAVVFHMNYFVSATIQVLRGGELDAHEALSFDCPPISSKEDWDCLLDKTWADAEELASLIESLPVERLDDSFGHPQYGTYYRCLHGPVEHCHYHLGQIAVMKAMLQNPHDFPTTAT